MTKVKYGLFVWRDAYTISLAERIADPSFRSGRPGLKLLETYESETWEEAVNFLRDRELNYYQNLNPDEVWNESDLKDEQ